MTLCGWVETLLEICIHEFVIKIIENLYSGVFWVVSISEVLDIYYVFPI